MQTYGYWLQRRNEQRQNAHYVSSEGDLDGRDRQQFEQGTPIQGWNCRAWIKSVSAEEDGPPDDGLANHFSLLVFSEKMRLALDDACIYGIQYLPLRVLKSDDTEYEGYAIANVINEISILNRDRPDSHFLLQAIVGGEVGYRTWNVHEPPFREEALRVFDIICVRESPEAVYVSQRFVDICHDHKLTGYHFKKVRLIP